MTTLARVCDDALLDVLEVGPLKTNGVLGLVLSYFPLMVITSQ